MNEIIVLVAKYAIAIPVLLAVWVFFTLESRQLRLRFAIFLVATGIISLALSRLGSHLISDPRPFVVGHFTPLLPHANDNGFPSDHTLLASALGFAIFAYDRWVGATALVVAASIGLARVAAGVHHLEDIVGSIVISGVAALIVLVAMRYLLPSRHEQTD